MSLKTALSAKLAALSDLTALVGERIYAEKAQQADQFPYLTYTVESTQRRYSTRDSDGLPTATVRLDCWGRGPRGYQDAEAVAEVLRQNLDGFRGAWGSVFVQCCKLEDAADADLAPEHASDDGTCVASYRATVWYNETAPSLVS